MAEKSKYQDIDAVDAALDKGVEASESVAYLELNVGELENEILGIDDITINDFSDYTSFPRQLVNLYWTSDTSGLESILIPVEGGRKITINASSATDTFWISCLKNDNTNAGSQASVCDSFKSMQGVSGGRMPVGNNGASFTLPNDCLYLYTNITIGGNTGRRPTSLLIEGQDGELDKINNDIEELQSHYIAETITWEQGGVNITDGSMYNSSAAIRTNFLNVDNFILVSCSKKYAASRILLYDSNKSYLGYFNIDGIKDVKSCGYCNTYIGSRYDLKKYNSANYFKVAIVSTGTISPNDDLYVNIVNKLCAENTKEVIYREGFNRMKSVFSNNKSCLKFVDTTDAHGNFDSLELADKVRNYNGLDIINISTGDFVNLSAKFNNVIDNDVEECMSIIKKSGVYFCLGQHEVGFQNISVGIDGKLKANCLTHDEAFNTWIKPMIPIWGLPSDHDTIWWYKDLTTQKLRLISLYQFNVPLESDPNDSTKYKYIRCALWYGQNQLDWLAQTLIGTPTDYKIVILWHEVEKDSIKIEDNNFFVTGSSPNNPIMPESPVADIVDAFISRTSINKVYTGVSSWDTSHDTADYTQLSVTANYNFSNAKGTFLCYFSGDTHIDAFGKLKNTQNDQLSLTVSSSTIPTHMALSNGNNDTIVTAFAFDRDLLKFNVARLGQSKSFYMTERGYASGLKTSQPTL